ITDLWVFHHFDQLIEASQGLELMLTPAIRTKVAQLICRLGLIQLHLGEPPLQLETLQLLRITFNASMLGTVQTVPVFLAWEHRVVMYTKSKDRDMSNCITYLIEVFEGNRCVLSHFVQNPIGEGVLGELDVLILGHVIVRGVLVNIRPSRPFRNI